MPKQHQPTASTSTRSLSATPSFTTSTTESEGSFYDGDTEIATDIEDEDMGPDFATGLYQRFPIREYLTNAGLPMFKHIGKPSLLALKNLGFALEWPKYRTLTRNPYAAVPETRSLTKVLRLGTYANIAEMVDIGLESFSAREMMFQPPVEGEHMLSMNLPCKAIVEFSQEDKDFLNFLQNEDDMFTLFKRYILDTASAATRMIRRYPLSVAGMDFKPANRFCPAHHAKWEIFILPTLDSRPGNEKIAMAVVFVPPWEFGSEDFKQFIAEKTFEDHSLDLLNCKIKRHIASDVMWAVIHETLNGRGTKFVFTNYINWTFGTFNSDWTTARVTDVYEANLTDTEGNTTWAPHQGSTVVELLSFWTHSCADKPTGY